MAVYVHRHSDRRVPEDERVIDLPCSWPTSCTFGGPDLKPLYVTSARFTMDSAHLMEFPQEGALMAVDTGFAGS